MNPQTEYTHEQLAAAKAVSPLTGTLDAAWLKHAKILGYDWSECTWSGTWPEFVGKVKAVAANILAAEVERLEARVKELENERGLVALHHARQYVNHNRVIYRLRDTRNRMLASNDALRELARVDHDLMLKFKEEKEKAEAKNAELRKALTQIVTGGYAPGADVAHPAIGVARAALIAAAREAGKGGAK